PSLRSLREAAPERLEQIEGIGPTIASAVHAWFATPRNAQLLDELVALGVNAEVRQDWSSEPGETLLEGWTVVVTGSLDGMTREEATAALEARGAKVTTSVSGKTSVVIAGADPGSKYQRAQSLGVTLADESALRHLLEHGDLPS